MQAYKWYCIPIIMLTARNDIVDKVLGLELGADDYITKPFNIKEVLARVKVAIRRVNKYKEKSEKEFIYINKFVKINLEGRIVFKDDEEVRLKPQEYELLEFLVKNRNIVFFKRDSFKQSLGIWLWRWGENSRCSC